MRTTASQLWSGIVRDELEDRGDERGAGEQAEAQRR